MKPFVTADRRKRFLSLAVTSRPSLLSQLMNEFLAGKNLLCEPDGEGKEKGTVWQGMGRR